MNSIDIKILLAKFNDNMVRDIIESWQNDPTVHPMTCRTHSDTNLVYENGVLQCPIADCFDHQHWIPLSVLHHWLDEGA